MKLFRLIIIIAVLLGPSSAICDDLTTEKKEVINELLEITGALQIGELFGNAVSHQMIDIVKKSNPDVDTKAFDIIKEEVAAIIHEELIVKKSLHTYMYPIYHKYLTLEETKELVLFYKTPIGKKAVSVLPKMAQEGMVAGQEWGKYVGPQLQRRLQARFDQEGIKID